MPPVQFYWKKSHQSSAQTNTIKLPNHKGLLLRIPMFRAIKQDFDGFVSFVSAQSFVSIQQSWQ